MMWIGALRIYYICDSAYSFSITAPYVSILMTSTGVLYGVLVAPTGLANIRRSSEDTLLPPQLPLAGLPCWLLNAFVFTAPMVVIVSVLVPSILLVLAVKKSEHLGSKWPYLKGIHELN
jgi:hypothetical protein